MSIPEMQVDVDLGERGYPILIGHDCLEGVGEAYRSLGLGPTAAIVTNPTVSALYLDTVRVSLEESGVHVHVLEMPDGEAYKTLETAEQILGGMIDAGLDRRSCVVTLGGGVVGDTAGFCAATYMRGIDFIQIPTTLEAQVDASVGGKTAVDHARGKNIIGAFHQPRMVYVDTGTLRTLPRREVTAGLAEVVKHGLIRDPELVTFLEEKLEALADLEVPPQELDWLIARNCEIKAGVVSEDERERGLREILNYGHTIGHALETITGYETYKHGEAVCLGMVANGRIAVARGIWSEADARRQENLLRFLGTRWLADVDVDVTIDLMSGDKKARGGVPRFVLLDRIGNAVTRDDVTRAEIEAGIGKAKAWAANP